MTCPREERVYDAIMGELEEQELESLMAHLDDCSICEATYDELMGTTSTLLDEGPEEIFLSTSARRKLHGELNVLYATKAPWYERWFPSFNQTPACALGLCIALLVGLYLGQGQLHGPQFANDKGTEELVVASVNLRTVFGSAHCKDQELVPKQNFALGDEIEGEKGARLSLDWRGRGEVLVEGQSFLQICRDGLRLRAGTVHCAVKPTTEGFFVHCPNHDVAVVGTRFSVTVRENGETKVSVSEGTVAVTCKATKKMRLLNAGDEALFATEVKEAESGTNSAMEDGGKGKSGLKAQNDDNGVVADDRSVADSEDSGSSSEDSAPDNESAVVEDDDKSTTVEEGF